MLGSSLLISLVAFMGRRRKLKPVLTGLERVLADDDRRKLVAAHQRHVEAEFEVQRRAVAGLVLYCQGMQRQLDEIRKLPELRPRR